MLQTSNCEQCAHNKVCDTVKDVYYKLRDSIKYDHCISASFMSIVAVCDHFDLPYDYRSMGGMYDVQSDYILKSEAAEKKEADRLEAERR